MGTHSPGNLGRSGLVGLRLSLVLLCLSGGGKGVGDGTLILRVEEVVAVLRSLLEAGGGLGSMGVRLSVLLVSFGAEEDRRVSGDHVHE